MKENYKSVSNWMRNIQSRCPMILWDSVGVNARRAFVRKPTLFAFSENVQRIMLQSKNVAKFIF